MEKNVNYQRYYNNNEQFKRYYAYYCLLNKMKPMTWEKEWEYYIHQTKSIDKSYEIMWVYLQQVEKQNKVIQETYAIIEYYENRDFRKRYSWREDEKTEIENVWQRIRKLVENEIEWEQKIYNTLDRTAKKHPIISKAIVIVLTSILLGLAEDCIHDAIQMNNILGEEGIVKISVEKGDSNIVIRPEKEDIIVEIRK